MITHSDGMLQVAGQACVQECGSYLERIPCTAHPALCPASAGVVEVLSDTIIDVHEDSIVDVIADTTIDIDSMPDADEVDDGMNVDIAANALQSMVDGHCDEDLDAIANIVHGWD